LVSNEVVARKVTYYLATEDDLHAVDESSILGGVSVTVAAAAASALLSVYVSKVLGARVPEQTSVVLNVLCVVLAVFAVGGICSAVHFYRRSRKTMTTLRGSGHVKSLTVPSGSGLEAPRDASGYVLAPQGGGLTIERAVYGTANASVDVTDELRAAVKRGRLEVAASNEIKGDPDCGTVKTLTIRYQAWGVVVEKEFIEGETVSLP
jgi:hypothetical protein